MKEKKSNFRGKLIASAQKQKKARSGYGYFNLPKGVKVFSVEEGARSVKLDFLPYRVTDPKHPERDVENKVALQDTLWYRRPYKIHRNVGAENEAIVCPTSIGQRCPICEYQLKRFKEGAPKEETTPLRAKLRSLYIVVPLDSKKYEEIPHIWDMSDSLFQEQLLEELEENDENECFADLEGGKTLNIRFRLETLGGRSYHETRKIDFDDRGDYDEAVLEEVPNLDEILTVLSAEEIHKKFFEMEDVDTVETPNDKDDADLPPARTKKTFKKRDADDDPAPDGPNYTDDTQDEAATTRVRPKKETKPADEPAKTIHRTPKKTDSTGERCPHGHRFGVDCEQFDDCDTCQVYDACIDEQQKDK